MGIAILIVGGFAVPVVLVVLAQRYRLPRWLERLAKNGNAGNVPTSGDSIGSSGDSGSSG